MASLRILRAFAWLRWRTLMNTIERPGGRDRLERFSNTIEQLAPVLLILVVIPSVLGLLGLGAYAGFALAAGGGRVLTFEASRVLLLVGCVFAVLGPIIMPAGERTNAVRLLLLPIPRAMLYLGQAASLFADPWMLFVLALVIGLPAGLALGKAAGAAAIASLAGALLLAILVGLALLVTGATHLLLRNRRRGEMVGLFLMLGITLLALLPELVAGERRQGTPAEAQRDADSEAPAWWRTMERTVIALVPSEVYVRSVRRAMLPDATGIARDLLVLIGAAGLLHGLAFATYSKVLDSPAVSGRRRTRERTAGYAWRPPGVSAGAAAIARSQVRLATRTPRGRLTVLSPIVVSAMAAGLMWRSNASAEIGPISLESGIELATVAAAFALLGLLPLAMNQFAIDGAGLTLTLLAPLDTRDLLVGKALGNAAIAAIPLAICTPAAAVMFPTSDLAHWLSLPLGVFATYAIVAPVAAVLSAIFPRAVDLNSIGKGSNAHGAAGLIGTLVIVMAGTIPLVLVWMATRMFERPALAVVLVGTWAILAAATSVPLFRLAARIFESRKETLVLASR